MAEHHKGHCCRHWELNQFYCGSSSKCWGISYGSVTRHNWAQAQLCLVTQPYEIDWFKLQSHPTPHHPTPTTSPILFLSISFSHSDVLTNQSEPNQMKHNKTKAISAIQVLKNDRKWTQMAKFMGPTWGPSGSCWPQMGPMLAPWTFLSREIRVYVFKIN